MSPFAEEVAASRAAQQPWAARSVRELVDILRTHFPEAVVEYGPRDQLMPMRGTLSIGKAARLIGYAPKFPLERGLAEYIDWYREFSPRTPSGAVLLP